MHMPPRIESSMIPTVLMIDDVPANLDILVANLQQENFELLVAVSGEEGIELAKSAQPDLILLDVMMPGLNGYETCARLKSDPLTSEIPVVFLSAKCDECDIEKGLRLGAVDFVNKPFSIPILKARMRNHLALKQKNQMLSQLAWTDELTQLANRRYFSIVAEHEWLRGRRKRVANSLIMIDVDNFKRYNDHYGHPAGDYCLQTVARCLSSCLHRPSDLIARYGGEEFLVMLPETDFEGAKLLAEQMRSAVFDADIEHLRNDDLGRLSISLGQLTCSADTPLESAIKLADQALYEAKCKGRNRVASLEHLALCAIENN